jgi:hypothetical protein
MRVLLVGGRAEGRLGPASAADARRSSSEFMTVRKRAGAGVGWVGAGEDRTGLQLHGAHARTRTHPPAAPRTLGRTCHGVLAPLVRRTRLGP